MYINVYKYIYKLYDINAYIVYIVNIEYKTYLSYKPQINLSSHIKYLSMWSQFCPNQKLPHHHRQPTNQRRLPISGLPLIGRPAA